MTPVQDKIISTVRSYAGVSLDCQRELLGQLVARNVDDPKRVVTIATNCATTALGFFHLFGIQHHLLSAPYVSGMAVAWLFTIGRDLGIFSSYQGDSSLLVPGMLLHYATPGKSNDHAEWLLGELDEKKEADHGGGGRARNAITVGHGPVLTSSMRPLRHYWNVPAAIEAIT